MVYDVPKRERSLEFGKSGMVSVVIPSKDHPEVLEKCLSSFCERTEYDTSSLQCRFPDNMKGCTAAFHIPSLLQFRFHKPCWSPDTMLSFCYMGHMIIIRKTLCRELLEEMHSGLDSHADFYDLCLRLEEWACARQYSISHIEEVLFHNCYEPDEAGSNNLRPYKRTGNSPVHQTRPRPSLPLLPPTFHNRSQQYARTDSE